MSLRVLVTGGRNYADKAMVHHVLNHIHNTRGIALLIQGGATGADSIAKQWAIDQKVPHATDEADWALYRGNAGRVRNCKMLRRNPDIVVAFPGGKGTRHMVKIAREANVPVFPVPALAL